MGAVTVAVMVLFLSAIPATLFILTGIAFLIVYFQKRKKQNSVGKAWGILPVISVCIGEIIVSPLCTVLTEMTLSKINHVFAEIVKHLWLGVFAAGVIMLLICAVKSFMHKKVGNKFLCAAVICFLVGFLVISILGMVYIFLAGEV